MLAAPELLSETIASEGLPDYHVHPSYSFVCVTTSQIQEETLAET